MGILLLTVTTGCLVHEDVLQVLQLLLQTLVFFHQVAVVALQLRAARPHRHTLLLQPLDFILVLRQNFLKIADAILVVATPSPLVALGPGGMHIHWTMGTSHGVGVGQGNDEGHSLFAAV